MHLQNVYLMGVNFYSSEGGGGLHSLNNSASPAHPGRLFLYRMMASEAVRVKSTEV